MEEVISILLVASTIIFFGFFAEFLFSRFKIPDILLLILFGIALGPYGLKYADPLRLVDIAPIFTTFALLFLLFEGAFNIDLVSFAKGVGKGMLITAYNFFLSSAAIAVILLFFKFSLMQAMLLGFILGGVSSAFVIPVIKNLRIKKETYSMLTLESAITDVLCIVFAITLIEIITLNNFNFSFVVGKLAALFGVAAFFGVIAGIVWIIIVGKLFRKNKPYMLTIAYLLLLFSVTEYLGGNGPISALFFGLVLRNSKKLIALVDKESAVSVTSNAEKFFYGQLSFFLKTFFFVYIGVLLDFSNLQALIIGIIIALVLMALRSTNSILTKEFEPYDKKMINSIFARGLAAAVLAQVAMQSNLQNAELIVKITFSVIMFTIILSSARVFLINKEYASQKPATKI